MIREQLEEAFFMREMTTYIYVNAQGTVLDNLNDAR